MKNETRGADDIVLVIVVSASNANARNSVVVGLQHVVFVKQLVQPVVQFTQLWTT